MSGIDARYKDELLTYDGQLRQKYEDKIYLITEPYLNTEYISFYIDSEDVLGIERGKALRQAVNYSIDREKMLRYLRNGIGEAATGGIIPAGLPGFDNTIGYDYDLKKAQRLVSENDLEGYTLNLSTTAEYADIGKFVQSQVEAVGLKCKMEVMPPATMRSMRANGSLSFSVPRGWPIILMPKTIFRCLLRRILLPLDRIILIIPIRNTMLCMPRRWSAPMLMNAPPITAKWMP